MQQKELEKYLLEFGYTKPNIKDIVDCYALAKISDEYLLNNIKSINKYLSSLNISNKDIIKIINKNPSIYALSKELINFKLDNLLLFYSMNDIIKMIKAFPQLISLSMDNINKKIYDLIDLGYSKKSVIKITKNFPVLFGFDIETIKNKIDDIVSLGYTKKEVIDMSSLFPPILSLSKTNILSKFNCLKELGYSHEEILKITKSFPGIYGNTIDKIDEKINFYKSINLDRIFVNYPKYLIQGIELTHARYCFLCDKDIDINNNYRHLFICQEKFESKYGLTNKKVIEKYKDKQNFIKK